MQPIPFPTQKLPGQQSILYLMPWMVVNGADLYDYYVLQTLRDTGQFRITVIIEQPVPWPHPWKVRARRAYCMHACTVLRALLQTPYDRGRARAIRLHPRVSTNARSVTHACTESV